MKLFNWLSKTKEPEKSPIKEFSQEDFDKLKFKARIAFIDDEEITHVDRLRNDGYNISVFSDISHFSLNSV